MVSILNWFSTFCRYHWEQLHLETIKHKEASKTCNQKIKASFFKIKDLWTINAEYFFTAFIIEHSLSVNCSDHADKLFKKMFPDGNQYYKELGMCECFENVFEKQFSQKAKSFLAFNFL